MFANAQEMMRGNPDTFQAPDLDDLNQDLAVGDFVKVSENKERYWIQVTGINWPMIHGKVNNDLLCVDRAFRSDVIIQASHVYELMKDI